MTAARDRQRDGCPVVSGMNDDTQGHAETIREALQWCENSTYAEVQRQRGLAALEALLSSAATTEAGPFTGRFVMLHDLDTEDFLPIGVLFEERDGTGTLRVFEDAEARDPHLSKMRREFESFEKAVSSWNRSALISTYTRIGACDVTI